MHQLRIDLVPNPSLDLYVLCLGYHQLHVLHVKQHLHSLPGNLYPSQSYQLLMLFLSVPKHHLHLVLDYHQQLRHLHRCLHLHGMRTYLHLAVPYQLRMR